MMKALFKYFCLTLALILCSCEDTFEDFMWRYEPPTAEPCYLCLEEYHNEGLQMHSFVGFAQLTHEGYVVGSKNRKMEFEVRSCNTAWQINNPATWLSFSPSSDGTYYPPDTHDYFSTTTTSVTVTAEKATSAFIDSEINAYRSAVATLTNETGPSGKYEIPIEIKQNPAPAILSVSTSQLYLWGDRTGKVYFTRNCNTYFSYSHNWIHSSFGNDGYDSEGNRVSELIISLDPNTTDAARDGYIYIRTDSDPKPSARINIHQYLAEVTSPSSTLTFTNVASSAKLAFKTEAPCTISTTQSWISCSATTCPKGDNEITISVLPNSSIYSRSGDVVFTIGTTERLRISVSQGGIYLAPSPTTLEFTAESSTKSISVSSNTSWSVLSAPEWLSCSPTNGTNDGSISVTTQANPHTYSRTGTIRIGRTGISLEKSISVVQAGRVFEASETVLRFSDKAGSQSISITSDNAWTAATADEWISISPSSASLSGPLSISVAENSSPDERIGTVRLTMSDKTIVVQVVQQGKFFTISGGSSSFTSSGGTAQFDLLSNDTWTARIEGESTSWLSLSATSGEGNAHLTVTAASNTTLLQRSASVYFEATSGPNVRINLAQAPPYLRVDTDALRFYAKGGESSPVAITTDAQYSIGCDAPWLSISQRAGSFIVTAAENLGPAPRSATIVIKMLGLTEGSYQIELPVTQLNYGGSFIRDGYDGDENWDAPGASASGVGLSSYSADENWNPASASAASPSSCAPSAEVRLIGTRSDKSPAPLPSLIVRQTLPSHK